MVAPVKTHHYTIAVEDTITITGSKDPHEWTVKIYCRNSLQTLHLSEANHRHWVRAMFDNDYEPPDEVKDIFERQLRESRVLL